VSRISPFKKVLLSAMVIGGLSFFTLANTFAVLNSEGSNTGSTIASGTLTIGNTVGAGTSCFSYTSATNSNASCDALFSSASLAYPGTPVTVHVTIQNAGTIKASALSIYMPSCTATASPGAPTPGGGNPCSTGGAMMYISESNSTFTTNSCVFPTSSGTCSFIANTVNALATTRNDANHMFTLGTTGLAPGASRYFIVAMQLPSTAANTLQGEEALFKLTWNLSQ